MRPPRRLSCPSKLHLWPRLLLFCLHILHIKAVGRLENRGTTQTKKKKKKEKWCRAGPCDKADIILRDSDTHVWAKETKMNFHGDPWRIPRHPSPYLLT